MGRIVRFLAALALIFALSVTVYAATGASNVSSVASVSADGSCQVSLSATLHLEQQVEKLTFPVPAEASGVTLNGARVSAPRSGGARWIDLSRVTKNVVGDVTINIHFSLHDVIHVNQDGVLEMQIPLLSGFAYPVEAMSFSVTMPGVVEVLPGFVSGYHQARIEEDLTYTVEGTTISGNSLSALKDHETLTMKLVVTDEMFPQSIAQTQDYHFGYVAMGICAALALIYWLVAMLNLPVWPQRSTEPPQGYTAGQLGCIVAGQGIDLSMTVLSWAQLGYVLIKLEPGGQVRLYKRMDMGNERSEAERRLFKKLFGKRDAVETSGYGYASLCRTVAKKPAGVAELMRRFTGNPVIFRALAAGIGLSGGLGLAVALADGAALQGLLVFLLGVAGGFSGWYIQSIGSAIVLRSRRRAMPVLILCGLWLLLSLVAGAFAVGGWMLAGLLLAGLLLTWGGRRTELGRQTLAQTIGLRRYLCKVDRQQLQHICETDPDYFFRLAPYAMALGADVTFAKRFGGKKLNGCPYLTSGMDGHMTALQWSRVLRTAVGQMDARAERLPLEKLIRMIRSITRQ